MGIASTGPLRSLSLPAQMAANQIAPIRAVATIETHETFVSGAKLDETFFRRRLKKNI